MADQTSHQQTTRQQTPILKKEDVKPQWFLVDATGKTLGRLACEIAKVLRGKHKPNYTPHVDSGDGVIVVNAEKIYVTGRKEAQKVYRHYTGYMSGMREIPYRTVLARKPNHIIETAVKGMLPKTKQGRAQFKRLRVVAGTDHQMEAQQPVSVSI